MSIFAAMQVHRSIDSLPLFKNAVITIGTFDGVHQGHKQIINAIHDHARKVEGESVIITFDPHPRTIVQPDKPLDLINTLEERVELLGKTGTDHLVIVPFTPAFASQTAEQYIEDFLIARFNPHTIVIGYDHHFGQGRKGNFALLQVYTTTYDYQLIEIPKQVLDAIAVSSTKIRQALKTSQIELANGLLGYQFFFEGIVVHGDALGRTLGYPTANLELESTDKIRLGDGVYAVYATIQNRRVKGMLSIGNRPTLQGSDHKIEVNLFDWNSEIYGEKVRVEVCAFLRGQEKYNTLDELVTQLHKDREASLRIL